MSKKIFTVMGATGKIGHVLVVELLNKGHEVRAIGRNQKKLDILRKAGAQILPVKQFDDINALTQSFSGADGIFVMLPPDMKADDYGQVQDKIGEATIQAIQKSKVNNIVNLSSVGAELNSGTGPILGLHRQEKRLDALKNINVLHLRAHFFMENLFYLIPFIKHTNTLGSGLRSDLPLPMVATADIGRKAADLLDTLEFKGHSFLDFEGPKEVTFNAIAPLLGKAIGKNDLKYKQIPLNELEEGLTSMGVPPKTAKLFIEMYQGFNDEEIHSTQKITQNNRGRITIENFTKIFANVYKEQETAASSRR